MTQRKEVTIYDIAKVLNLSASTVSRGLRGHTSIRKETVRKIKETARSMGYQQNPFASSLRKNSSNTIGVILPRLDSNFQSSVVSGIENRVNQEGYNLIISQSRESVKQEIKNLNTMFNTRVDGLMVSLACDTCNLDHFKNFMDRGIPVVLFDRVKDHPDYKLSKVIIDNFKAGYTATSHLISQGCRRIMFVGDNLMSNVYSERHRGYKQAMGRNHLRAGNELLFVTSLDEEAGERTWETLDNMTVRPDGIFAANDTSAVSIINSLKKVGVRVPEDIAVVGFNDVHIARIIEPALTTIHYPGFEMGVQAADTLIGLLKNDGPVIPKTIILEHELIVRQSSLRATREVLVS